MSERVVYFDSVESSQEHRTPFCRNPNFQGGAHSEDHAEAFLPSERGIGAGEELLDSSMLRGTDEFGNPEIVRCLMFFMTAARPTNYPKQSFDQ